MRCFGIVEKYSGTKNNVCPNGFVPFSSNFRPLSLADLLVYRICDDEHCTSPDAREAYRMRAGERLAEYEHARKKAEGRADVLDEPDK